MDSLSLPPLHSILQNYTIGYKRISIADLIDPISPIDPCPSQDSFNRSNSLDSVFSNNSRSSSVSSSDSVSSGKYDHQKTRLPHLTGHSKRQRKGPSCDLCQLKKIKCDAYIEVLNDTANSTNISLGELTPKYLTNDEISQGFKLIHSKGKLIKFRNCSHCQKKNISSCFKRGFTKEDVMKYEEDRGRVRTRKAYRKRKGKTRRTRR
jgi:hypothetical protein